MAFGATSEENRALDRYFGGEPRSLAEKIPHELLPAPNERHDGSIPVLLAVLAMASVKAYGCADEEAMKELTVAVSRARALEAFWSAWKDVEASGVGYSASFTEAAKRLRELEA